jgi:spore germination protein GerM
VRLAAVALALLAACSSGTDIDVDVSATTTSARQAVVVVHLLPEGTADCATTEPVTVPATEASLAGALEALVRGDEVVGYRSMFTPGTAGSLRSVTVQDGVAYVDLDDVSTVIPDASASCGSAALLAQLDRTVEGFDGVESAVYSFEGSRSAFYEWLQLAAPADGGGS